MVMKKKSRKPSHATCALCAGKLNAVPRRRPSDLAKLSKTEKRPERAFGGVLCANCLSKIVKQKTRIASGSISPSAVPLHDMKFLKMLK